MVTQLKSRQKEDHTNTRLNTWQRDHEYPAIRFTATITVASVSASGDAVMQSTIEDATVLDDVSDPRVRKAAEAGARFVKGMRTSWTLAPNGVVSEIVFDVPNASRATQNALGRFADSVNEWAAEFPDEPLGVGAAWRVESVRTYSGLKWNRTATYRVMALSEASVTLDEVVVMNTGEQALSVEPNATTTVTSGHANVTGQIVIPFRGLVATGTEQVFTETNYLLVRGHRRDALTLQQETLASQGPADATPGAASPAATQEVQTTPASSTTDPLREPPATSHDR